MSKMDLLDKLRMRLWLENRRLYGSGGNRGEPVNINFTPQDLTKIQIDPNVAIPEHYKRVLVQNDDERKTAFRKLLKDHGIKIEGNRYNPDLFTYFLSVLRARAPYTIEGTQKALAKRKAARDKRAAKRRAARARNRGNAANGDANEEEGEDNEEEEEDENAVQEVQPPARARARALTQRRKTRKTRKTRTSSATSPASRRYYFRERNN